MSWTNGWPWGPKLPLNRRRAFVLGAVAICAVLLLSAAMAKRTTRTWPDLGVSTEGAFKRDGHFPGEPLDGANALRFWGSWSGDDARVGRIALGPFPAPPTLRFALGGYPARAGNELYVERSDTGERHPLRPSSDVGERWRRVEFALPAAWTGHPIRLVAQDNATQLGGWLALSEPWRGGPGSGPAELLATLAAWAANGLLLGVVWFAALRFLHRRTAVPAPWLPVVAAAATATAGYGLFWLFFAHTVAGQLASLTLLALGLHGTMRTGSPEQALPADALAAPRLAVAISLAYLALLHLFPSALEFHALAANRFGALPGDNTLPHNVARSLFEGTPLRHPHADWLSSDRPPLQSGWLLIARPVTTRLGLDEGTVDGTAAIWFQLMWVLSAFALLRTTGLPRPQAAGCTALLAATGFHLLNSVFTWPKLGAAALLVGAFALWQGAAAPGPQDATDHSRRHFTLGAALAALAWLAHGGVAFSLLALAPWAAWRAWRGGCRPWLPGVLAFAAFALPWQAYQKFYDPPGNRLLKWHLGGQVEKDARGTWQTIREGYQALSWEEIVRRRVSNLELQVAAFGRRWHDFSLERAADRRNEEFFWTGRSLAWWPLGLIALPIALLRKRRTLPWRIHATYAAWAVGTILIWCTLMFMERSAVVHQGSYAVQLVLSALLAAWCTLAGRGFIAVVGAVQVAAFATTWGPRTPALHDPAQPAAMAVLLVAGAALAWLVRQEWRRADAA